MSKAHLSATAHILPFNRLSAGDFERLCLWLVEAEGYERAEHYGSGGDDGGRDVIAFKPTSDGGDLWYFQCKRRQRISGPELRVEVDKIAALAETSPPLRPAGITFVLTCNVSAKVRDDVRAHASAKGFQLAFWAESELDARVKKYDRIMREFFAWPATSQQPVSPRALALDSPAPALGWTLSLLASDPYYRLPGREADIGSVLQQLDNQQGCPIVAIDGLGGLGKTAMAVEIARRSVETGLFDQVMGESAKQERLVGETIEPIPDAYARMSFDDLMDSIARQLGRWDIAATDRHAKRDALHGLLCAGRYLVLADNLETAENARGLALQLRALLGASRAVITSRPQLDLDFVWRLSLHGLAPSDAQIFLHKEAKARNLQALLGASDEELANIHDATDGAPLAMKLVAAQSDFLPLERVLESLRNARGNIYKFIYEQSWSLMSPAAQKLLIYVGVTAVTDCSYEELVAAEIVSDTDSLDRAIGEAVRMSLLDPVGPPGVKRYAVHALTRHFVRSELPRSWQHGTDVL